MKIQLLENIEKLACSFRHVLYQDDVRFLKNMESNNLAGDDIKKYRFWEWTQGVGLFGFWKLYKHTGAKRYYQELIDYYEERFKEGLPSKNINTVAPMLPLAFIYEESKEIKYLDKCLEWSEWIMKELPRTKEGGFQHITSDTLNDEELWDDTLFMTVLFLAKMGQILGKKEYIEEAKYQFLLHIKYLVDRKTGLWFHGWTFNGNHNFANALWGRGNCWVTIAIPELLDMLELDESYKRYLIETLIMQVDRLKEVQGKDGMWHTLLDDETSYTEASATCGFGYGILKGVHMGIIPEKYLETALKALPAILNLIDEEGVINQVSYGTPMGRETLQFYKDIPIEPMPYGQALAMLFLIEVLENIKNEADYNLQKIENF